MKLSENSSRGRRLAFLLLGVAVIGSASVFWKMSSSGIAAGDAGGGSAGSIAADPSQSGKNAAEPFVELSDKQAGTLKIDAAGERDFALFKTAVGTIDFNENLLVQVSSQYSGKIIKAFSNIGDEVKLGDTLFTIDSPDLLQAESTLLASAGVLELQKRTLGRTAQLVKSGGAAQKDLDQSTSDEQTAEGAFKAARNAVRIFGKTDADIEQILAERKVDSTLVVPSPISGRVIARSASPGLLSQPGASPAPYTVVDLSTMWMLANVIETDAPAYKLGQDVEVRVPAYPETVFKGHVTALGSIIDPNSHRQLVRSEIDDPRHLLRSGMFASFVIRVGDPVRSSAVPVAGVVREGDGTMTAWITRDRHRFLRRTVKVGLQQDGWAQILDGLQPGESVVTDGAIFLSNKFVTGAEG